MALGMQVELTGFGEREDAAPGEVLLSLKQMREENKQAARQARLEAQEVKAQRKAEEEAELERACRHLLRGREKLRRAQAADPARFDPFAQPKPVVQPAETETRPQVAVSARAKASPLTVASVSTNSKGRPFDKQALKQAGLIALAFVGLVVTLAVGSVCPPAGALMAAALVTTVTALVLRETKSEKKESADSARVSDTSPLSSGRSRAHSGPSHSNSAYGSYDPFALMPGMIF